MDITPSNTKYQSRIERLSTTTVQDLLLYLDRKQAELAALNSTGACNEVIEAIQCFQQKLSADSATVFRIAELLDNQRQQSKESDPGFPPGMA